MSRRLALVSAAWCPEAEQALERVIRDGGDDPADIAATVHASRAELLEVRADGVRVGWIVARVEAWDAGDWVVVLAAAGSAPGGGLADGGLEALEDRARELACDGVAMWTARPGLIVAAQRRGYVARVRLERGL